MANIAQAHIILFNHRVTANSVRGIQYLHSFLARHAYDTLLLRAFLIKMLLIIVWQTQ